MYFEKQGPFVEGVELVDEGYVLTSFGINCTDRIAEETIIPLEINDNKETFQYKVGEVEVFQVLDVEITSLKSLINLDERFLLVGFKEKKGGD